MTSVVVLTLVALLTSTLSGVVGMGGGTLLLAAMVLSGLQPWVAIPVHAAVQLVSNATRTLVHLPRVRWRVLAVVLAAALPGPLLGLWIVEQASPDGLRAVMGLFILWAVWGPVRPAMPLGEVPAFAAAGVLGGTLGVVVGAVGPLLAPFFLQGGYPKETIIGTKAACQSSLHVLKLAAFGGLYPALLAAQPRSFDLTDHGALVVPLAAATVLGTAAGTWLLGRVREDRFLVLYRLTLTGMGIRLVLSPWA